MTPRMYKKRKTFLPYVHPAIMDELYSQQEILAAQLREHETQLHTLEEQAQANPVEIYREFINNQLIERNLKICLPMMLNLN